MLSITKPQQRYLLFLARRAVEYSFDKGARLRVAGISVPFPELVVDRGCFVSLHTALGNLRGCMGTIKPEYPLYQAVVENALAAAFRDPRFPMLTPEEFENVVFEVSVLSPVGIFEYSSPKDLASQLEKTKPGVVLKQRGNIATYLPQVWDRFDCADDFLSSLCQKAGLEPSAWRGGDVTIQTYTAQVFGEKAPGIL